jgi:hypothetical protein
VWPTSLFENSRGQRDWREPLERRKAALEKLLARAGYGVTFNEHIDRYT